MKRHYRLFLAVIATSSFANADLANDLLQASDQGRGGIKEGITWNIKIETTEEGESTTREFLVKAKDHDAYVEAISPARNKGEIFLFNDRMMWFYKPGLKKPVGISSRQKLTGQAANGDIASTHYARDYTATLEKSEVVGGAKMAVLLLKAKTDNLTYDQIRYWVDESSKLAKKAEFLTLQGTPFKIGDLEYKNELVLQGKKHPFVSRLKITDAKFPQNFSVITYASPKVVNLPENLFNVNRLSR
jgi:putative ABC transport system permease protein